MSSQMYSIKSELNILRRFVDMEYDGNRRCYSEKDISAAEERLHYKLPLPIRELYLYMSDILLDMYDLRPLELLHWQQDYLCFFDPPEGNAVGICRKDDPNALYTWEEIMPDEDQDALCDLNEEFEEYDEENNMKGKNAIARKYSANWDKINLRCTEASEHESDYFEKLRESIEQEFTPVSEHLELIDIFPLPMAYVHKTANALLICNEEADFLTLLSDRTVAPGFIEKIQNCLALPFRQCHQ